MPDRLLFYNSNDGSGGLGTLSSDSFSMDSFNDTGFFPTGWGLWALSGSAPKFLLYDPATRAAEQGRAKTEIFPGGISTLALGVEKSFPPGSFSSWTHIVARQALSLVGSTVGCTLFYDKISGAGALCFDPPRKTFPDDSSDSFSTGWTHIVYGRATGQEFFYNSDTGAGAVSFDPPDKVWPAGTFAKGWTHVAVGPGVGGKDTLLFYNRSNRSGAIAALGFGADFKTLRTWGPGEFSSWSHVVGSQKSWLFYDRASGRAEIAIWQDPNLASKPDTLDAGWTHIVQAGRGTG
ncbi:hypothetical protein [Streptomyces sp. NPDC001502]|uniref:hypothetical protein n=1 Tax=Streptomyces sp. NPDC001502 TaxID=3364578 RepID=UPI00367D8DEF